MNDYLTIPGYLETALTNALYSALNTNRECLKIAHDLAPVLVEQFEKQISEIETLIELVKEQS